jgi:regulator of replication initiation timing
MISDTRNGASETGPRVQQVRDELEQLRAENAKLRHDNRALRRTLDAHLKRRAASSLYGPVEMTAGTCVGPRRRHSQ